MSHIQTVDELLRENEELRRRCDEAEDALRALRAGEVDAILVEGGRDQVYTLEAVEQPYRLLVERMLQGAATLTEDGAILYCNATFAELLGRPQESLVGRALAEFVVPESRVPLEELLRDGRSAEARRDIALSREDGQPATAYLCACALAEGALGVCLLVMDRTEQRHYQELRRTQEALKASEAALASELAAARRLQEVSSSLLHNGDGEIYRQILDVARDILHADMATMQVLDTSRDALRLIASRGFEPEFLEACQWVGPESSTVCGTSRRSLRRTIVPDIETCDFLAGKPELEVLRRGGIRAVQSTPLLSRGGRLLGMISTHWREPHQPHERDLQLLDVLARQAADLLERRSAEEALRNADRRKDEFLATLAHELRNPLAPIRNAAQILKIKSSLDPQILWCRDVIDRQVALMARLLEDLLDVSRISRDVLELRKETVELAEIVEVAIETSRPLIAAGGHELVTRLPAEKVLLCADPLRLEQMLSNLLNNAAKYTEVGGRIELVAVRDGTELVVSVKDTGIGLTAEAIPQIFEMFSQAKTAQARSQGGLGVGLSLVHGLVKLHGGSVEAKSEGPGRGSEFVVRAPIVEEDSEREVRPRVAEPTPPRRFRMLVVDDNVDGADSLATMLRELGNEVGVVYDGEQAIQAVATSRPEIVLLDIGMPGLDGCEACRRIRAQPHGHKPFVIALTGWGQEEDRRKTDEAGFDAHIVKPVDAAELLELLATAPQR